MKKLRRIFFVLVAVILVSCTIANVGAATVNFTDTDGHWAWTGGQIPYLVDKDVLNGYPEANGTYSFKPDNQVKRAEFIKMLDETFGLTATKAINFSDVTANDWYNVYFQKAAAQGYLLNYGTKANPEGLISREEAISLLVRYLNLDKEQKASTSTFTDYATINANYRDYVLEAIYAGLINGYEQNDGTHLFKPQQTLSRAEALTILYRAAGCIYNKTSYVRDNGAPDTNSVITTGGVTIQDQTLTGRVIISEGASSDIVTFSNCKITDTLYIRGNAKVYFDKCTVNNIVITGTGGISLLTSTTVNKIEANSKATLSITKGTKVNTLNVNASATGANVIGDGEIAKLAVRCANFTSNIMPEEFEILNGHTATLAGKSYSGSTENDGIFSVAPYVTADKVSYYLEFTATKNGTAYYYFTNSAAVPTVDEFDTAYLAATVKNRVSAKANVAVSTPTGALALLKDYRYVVVMFQSGTTKYNPVVVVNTAETSTGFTTEPYYSETDNTVKFKAGVAGTVYYYYTESGANLTQTQFLNAYNDTESALKGTVNAVNTRTVASITLNKTYAARYGYIAVMLKSSAGTNYAPVVVALSDDGFATLPAIQANGSVTFKTDVAGTVYYYYSKTADIPTPTEFYNQYRTATYRGSVKANANINGSFEYNSSYASAYPYLVVCVVDNAGTYKRPVVIELTSENGFVVEPKFISDTRLTFTTENAGVVKYYFTTASSAPADDTQFDQIYNYMPLDLKGQVNCYSSNFQGFITVPPTVGQNQAWYIVLMLTDRTTGSAYAPMILRVKYDPTNTITGFVYQPYIKDGELYIKTAANTTVRYYYSKYTSAVTPAEFYSEYSAADASYRGEVYVQANDVRKITIDPNARLLYRTIVVACYNGYAYSEPVVLSAFTDTPGVTGSTGFTYSVTEIVDVKALSVLPSYTGTLYYYTTNSLVEANSAFNKANASSMSVIAGKIVLLNGDGKKYLVLALEANDRMYDTVVIDTTTWTQKTEERYDDRANSQSTGFTSFVSISGGCKFTTSYDGMVYITLVGDGKVIPWNGATGDGNVGYVTVKRGEVAEFDYTGIMASVLTDSKYSEYAHIYLYIQGFELPMTRYTSQVITLK